MTSATTFERFPLAGRTALVTGVSRPTGIGYAVARRLAEQGASVFVQHFTPHDLERPWRGDDLDEVRAGIRSALTGDAVFGDCSCDLTDVTTVAPLMDAAAGLADRVDILVCAHARRSADGSILETTAESLDGHWQVTVRSTILLTRLFAEQFIASNLPTSPAAAVANAAAAAAAAEHTTGRVFWLTSGQNDAAMPGEVAYAANTAALAGLTPTVAKELLQRGIILNTINPGPVDTGYLDPETSDRPLEEILDEVGATPFGRFGEPADVARLIGWLAGDDARWIVGQVITSDGGLGL